MPGLRGPRRGPEPGEQEREEECLGFLVSPGAVAGPPRMPKEGLAAFEGLQGESRVSGDQGSWQPGPVC